MRKSERREGLPVRGVCGRDRAGRTRERPLARPGRRRRSGRGRDLGDAGRARRDADRGAGRDRPRRGGPGARGRRGRRRRGPAGRSRRRPARGAERRRSWRLRRDGDGRSGRSGHAAAPAADVHAQDGGRPGRPRPDRPLQADRRERAGDRGCVRPEPERRDRDRARPTTPPRSRRGAARVRGADQADPGRRRDLGDQRRRSGARTTIWRSASAAPARR